MPFNPKPKYDVIPLSILIRHFTSLRDRYIVRPPYQRKTVWSVRKQTTLLDSLFRRSYVPKIVLREVRLANGEEVREVIDGQQRINTVQKFFEGELVLPKSLQDIDARLPGKRYSQLSADIREFIDEELKYEADLVKGINDPGNPQHLKIASEIFWRLQLGDKLRNMEVAHARLFSTMRNFLVRYADDYDFDISTYESIETNSYKHPFFRELYGRNNRHMEHLTMLGRLLLLEIADGPETLTDADLTNAIEKQERDDGIGNYSYEDQPHAKRLLRTLHVLYEIYQDDLLSGAKVFSKDYLVISYYLLLKHLRKHYVFASEEHVIFRDFIYHFHEQINSRLVQDPNLLRFPESRQMGRESIEERHRIIRHELFNFVDSKGYKFLSKDKRRTFTERERIAIYLSQNGVCQECKRQGKPEQEAIVPWSDFEADHVLPHSKGGQTLLENGQVLCRIHNRRKGATL